MAEVTPNPLTVPTPLDRGTQAAPVVTTPARMPMERGMRQEGVINKMREASLERAKVAGRAAQQHVDMMNASALAAVSSALKAPEVSPLIPTQPSPVSAAVPSSAPVVAAPPAVPSAPTSPVSMPPVEVAPPAASTAPSIPVPTTPVAETPKFPNKQVEVSWNTIRESEKQLAAQRAQFLAEKQALEAEKAKGVQPNVELQSLQQLQQGLKTNLAGTLKSLGYNASQVAEVAMALNGTPIQQQQVQQQPVQPQFVPQQAPVPQRAESNAEIAELRQQLQAVQQSALTLQNVIITQQYNAELAKPEFDLLRAMPDALDRAIGAWQNHHGATGRGLSTQEACARAQEELVSAKKAEFERLNSNPAWSKALGSLARPTPDQAPAAQQAGATGAAPEITSMSANLAPGGPVPPVTVGTSTQWLPPEEARRMQAIERARKAGEATRQAR